DASAFGWPSLIILIILTVLSALRTPELAVFFALMSLFMSLAFMTRSTISRLAFWVLSSLILFRLVFFEELGLIQRLLTENRIHSFGGILAYEAFFIVLFTFFSLPFVFGFVAIHRASGVDLLWLNRYRTKWGMMATGSAVVCVSIYLLFQPVYNERWCNRITV